MCGAPFSRARAQEKSSWLYASSMNTLQVPLRLAEQVVLARLADMEPATRNEIADVTGLPKTTVVAASNSLLERGLITEETELTDAKRAGRPATTLRLDLDDALVVLIDLTREGTRLSVGDCLGREIGNIQLAVDYSADIYDFTRAVRLAFEKIVGARRVEGVVLSVPAAFEPGKGLRATTPAEPDLDLKYPQFHVGSPWFKGDPSQALATAFGLPSYIENDANLAALGEAHFGAGKNQKTVVGVSIRLGIGAGIIIDGAISRGSAGDAGELAHVTVEENGRLCSCGNRGCLITVIGESPLLLEQISAAYERPVSMEQVLELVRGGDAGVNRVLKDHGRQIGRALGGFIAMFEPQMVVVDGSIGSAADSVVDGVAESLALRTQPLMHSAVSIVSGELGHSAQLMGAISILRDRKLGHLARAVRPSTYRWAEPDS